MQWLVADGYGVARLLVSRGIALVYLIAFANIIGQWRPLLGERGLLPVPDFVVRVPARATPSLFHRWYSDRLAIALAWLGVTVAGLLLVGLPQRGPSWLPLVAFGLLWGLYLSYVNVGQIWYGFGWESILLDAGAIAVLLGSEQVAATWPVLLMARWLVFRIEFGAGLIKLRGDPCWRNLTCLEYHHETQPMPGPMSWFFHHLPRSLHRVETGANHVVQLVVPFGLFLPQPVAGFAAVAIIVTQGWLLVSGNFSWLNVITIVLAASALPDAWFVAERGAGELAAPEPWLIVAAAAATLATAWMSRRPIANMLSRGQRMNASFNPWHLVGTYGAFGSVTRTRYEVVIEGTEDEVVGPDSDWRAYEFRGKPGGLMRRPRQWAPYHLRLDWLLWFLAMSPGPGARHGRWYRALLAALLRADPAILALLHRDPFEGRRPAAVRAHRYRYRFTTPQERRTTGAWWWREPVGAFSPPLTGDGASRAPSS